jgi:hypothetical protein
MREVLHIGGIAMAIDSLDERLIGALEAPMTRFVVEETGEVDFTVTARVLERYQPPRGECLFDSDMVWSLHRDGDGLRIECRSDIFGAVPYKIAVIDRDFRRADVFVRLLDGAHAHPLEFPLDELLFNALLTRRGALEVHACGVIENGEGSVFIGNSGDGKTTTARLWQGSSRAEIVSDDRVILRPHDGTWWMYGTPWHGEAELCSPSRAPLRRIFTLDKGGANHLTPLSAAHAAARLLACAFPPFHDAEGMMSVIAISAALASEIPVARFSFLNEPSAVQFIRSLPASKAA